MLITGLTGVAGFNVFRHFRQRYGADVLGIRQQSNWPLNEPGTIPCDIEDRLELTKLFDRFRFASVVNCSGNCALKSCELDPSMAWRINLECVRNLLEVIGQRELRLVHLSIDLVFSGTSNGDHVESDPTDPVTVYGQTMAAAEQLVLLSRPDACLLRISLPMGMSYGGHAGAIDWIQSRFKQGKPATLYFDEVRTPTYCDCLNRVIQAVLASSLNGLYHAGGPRKLTLYQIAQIVNRIGGYDPRHLMGCYRREAGPVPPRAGDVTMNSDRLRQAIGFQPFDPWPIEDHWVPNHRFWHWDRSRHEPGSADLLKTILYCNPRHSGLRSSTQTSPR
jgi:dTDP-4-dehydrorhamnose reductase